MEKKLMANSQIVFRREDDEAILFNPANGEIKFLNETGAFIYGLLDGKRREEEIVGLLMRKFDIDNREAVAEDLRNFLGDLRRGGLAGESG